MQSTYIVQLSSLFHLQYIAILCSNNYIFILLSGMGRKRGKKARKRQKAPTSSPAQNIRPPQHLLIATVSRLRESRAVSAFALEASLLDMRRVASLLGCDSGAIVRGTASRKQRRIGATLHVVAVDTGSDRAIKAAVYALNYRLGRRKSEHMLMSVRVHACGENAHNAALRITQFILLMSARLMRACGAQVESKFPKPVPIEFCMPSEACRMLLISMRAAERIALRLAYAEVSLQRHLLKIGVRANSVSLWLFPLSYVAVRKYFDIDHST